jgi:hypothetical protein
MSSSSSAAETAATNPATGLEAQSTSASGSTFTIPSNGVTSVATTSTTQPGM